MLSKHGLSITAGVLTIFLGAPVVIAQTTNPTMVITWQTSNYTPSAYAGKDLPSPGSTIFATLSLIKNGKFLDISNEFISWYLDNHPLKNGKGLATVTMIGGGGGLSLRAEMPNFDGTGIFLIKTIAIPIVSPQVVIKSPIPSRIFSGGTIRLFAIPYFFNSGNSSMFTVSWKLNGTGTAAVSANPYAFDLTVPPNATSGDIIAVTATVQSTNPTFDESGAQTIPFTYQQ